MKLNLIYNFHLLSDPKLSLKFVHEIEVALAWCGEEFVVYRLYQRSKVVCIQICPSLFLQF